MESLFQWLSTALESRLGSGFHGPGFIEMGLALGIAYLGGILSSLTPCIYPMIPITISVVGGTSPSQLRSEKGLWKSTLFRSLLYISGMSLIYAFLGVLAALTGKVFGSVTQSWGWVFGLGIFMNLTALVMLDILPFDPQAWWNHFRHRSGRGGHHVPAPKTTWFGVFLLGATSGFIAAPCTTPVFASLLGYVAQTQSVGFGLLLMLFFAFGLGTILMVIALFTGALQILPKSGAWLKTIKVLSGILLLAYAEYLIYRAGTLGGI